MRPLTSLPATGDLDSRVRYLRSATYRYARRKGLCHDDAEDLAQTCVVTVLQSHRAVLSGEGQVRDLEGWLRGCARHMVIDHIRRTAEKPARQAPLRQQLDGRDGEEPEIPDDTCDPELCMEREECRRRIRRAIDGLRDVPHFYVLERFYLGFSVEEIAAHHGASTNQVYKALKRALCDLGRLLSKEGLTEADLRCILDSPSRVFPAFPAKKALEENPDRHGQNPAAESTHGVRAR